MKHHQKVEQPPKDYEYFFKILFCGDIKSGKTSIIKRYSEDQWDEENEGIIDNKIKIIHSIGKAVKLQLFDQPKGVIYYRGAHIIIIVYDCTSMESFKNVCLWLGEIERYSTESVLKYVFCNKCDLVNERVVTQTHIEELTQKFQNLFKHFEVSAKYFTNINETFDIIASDMIANLEKINPTPNPTNTTTNSDHIKKNCSVQ
ncbi:hypothetical protein RB653_002566 [Dictyostelium firmibasis]|uniref:Rab GTPase n=1 Tax=Dictyostelium firmibasis TaxID=79012 RepID=A0AAN7U9I0_9MYCE